MGNRPNVVIVMARCRQTKEYYGIRFEENRSIERYPKHDFGIEPNQLWVADWAFEIKKESADREGYAKTEISGSFSIAPAYPGCPSCHGRSIFKCGCGKVACWDGKSQMVTCPYCGMTGLLSGQIDRLSSGGDR